MFQLFDTKIKINGNIIGLAKYEKPLCHGYRKSIPDPVNQKYPLQDSIAKSARRSKTAFIDLVNRSFGAKPRYARSGKWGLRFLTLTFAENLQNRKLANYEFRQFVRRLEYFLGEKFLYVCVPERQKRGAYHFHLLMYSPFILWEDILRIWNVNSQESRGAWIEKIRGIGNLGSYLAKYMSKDMSESDKYSKRYFGSRGLDRKLKIGRYLSENSLEKGSDNVKFHLGEFIREEKYFACEGKWTGRTQYASIALQGNFHQRLARFWEVVLLIESTLP
ncbi:MAG TPA: hypothetical protein VN278_06045 [Methanosarcina sp.]|nr:hypothetical protein [Methanosarcina sp.]